MNTGTKSTCIVGIGNSLRSDDGVGVYLCSLIEEEKLPVTVVTTHQLDIAMVESLAKFDTVIFVDAAVNEVQFSFQLLNTVTQPPQSSSHHINAAMLASLARQLFNAPTQFYLCAIGATDFEMGSSLSEQTKTNASGAAAMLSHWIQLHS